MNGCVKCRATECHVLQAHHLSPAVLSGEPEGTPCTCLALESAAAPP